MRIFIFQVGVRVLKIVCAALELSIVFGHRPIFAMQYATHSFIFEGGHNKLMPGLVVGGQVFMHWQVSVHPQNNVSAVQKKQIFVVEF